jgi:aryl-alcohol dehydrogenase-like predicted oxidoreductase
VEYRQLGRSGLKVSAVGLGTNNFASRLHDDAARQVLNEAIEQGVTFIDTADVYGRGATTAAGSSEEQLGRLLAGRRNGVVIATKFRHAMSELPNERGASRAWLMSAVEGSLRRLRTDYIDLYQIHAPDPETPVDETLRALDDLVRAGKVRYVGHSNFPAWQIADADWAARTEHLSRPVSAQMHYNLLNRAIQAEVIPACEALGLGIVPYFPLESGLLTGKYGPGKNGRGRLLEHPRAGEIMSPESMARVGRLEAWASEADHSLLDLAFGWLLSQPVVSTVIASASSPEQVRANVAASGWRLATDQMQAVAQI